MLASSWTYSPPSLTTLQRCAQGPPCLQCPDGCPPSLSSHVGRAFPGHFPDSTCMFGVILSCLLRPGVMVNHCELLAAPTTLGRTPGYVFTASRVSVIPGRANWPPGTHTRIWGKHFVTVQLLYRPLNVVFICSSFKWALTEGHVFRRARGSHEARTEEHNCDFSVCNFSVLASSEP